MDNKTDNPKRRNGRTVALVLAVLCGTAFFGTLWYYHRTHPFATDATVLGPDTVEADFSNVPGLAIGQRAVISVPGNSAKGGTVSEIQNSGKAVIRLDSDLSAPAGTKARVNIDGTVGPRPSK